MTWHARLGQCDWQTCGICPLQLGSFHGQLLVWCKGCRLLCQHKHAPAEKDLLGLPLAAPLRAAAAVYALGRRLRAVGVVILSQHYDLVACAMSLLSWHLNSLHCGTEQQQHSHKGCFALPHCLQAAMACLACAAKLMH